VAAALLAVAGCSPDVRSSPDPTDASPTGSGDSGAETPGNTSSPVTTAGTTPGTTTPATTPEQGERARAETAVADALTAHGFAAHADSRNDRLRIINDHCPFGDVAIDHPVICAVDRGMVRGMLSELTDTEFGDVTTESSLPAGDTFCSTAV